MLEEIKIELQHLGELYSKRDTSNPHIFNFGKLTHSGRHAHDIMEEL